MTAGTRGRVWGMIALLFLLAATLVGLGLYFLPAIIGFRKRNRIAILVLNLFLGWTFIGWVVALVWACTRDPET